MEEMLGQGDRIRAAKETLDTSLKAVEQSYSTSDQPHSGGDDCERCIKRKADIRRAYYTYYLDADPDKEHGYWARKYKEELDKRYNDPQTSLDDLHSWFRLHMREVVRDICATSDEISPDALMEIFHDGRPTNDSLNICLTHLQQTAPNPDAATFTAELQKTRTAEERAQLYIKYYCSTSPNDSSLVKNFKAKYARIFEQQEPFNKVLEAMEQEAKDLQSVKLARLQRDINELEMAQSAHTKAQAKKDQKKRDREPTPGVAQCSLDGCANEINLATDEIIECADEHDRHDHQCCMGARCYYYPQPGPPGETGGGGLCQDCGEEEFTSYFCSQDCYHHNLELHRDDFHDGKGIHNDSDHLDIFSPAEDMEIVS
ncbi:uncharacterized protein PAC_01288 [Phialocephala subalpina]|uniref:Uncharacterized protein n=1 Tax=Phialocephala subalpina TaxID=576137 RepID=A0A1L7WF61_9HELO|nr:uncharacterized protein PAC_01288 [Phialocephala subalpina]